jgi:hypothetical protein
MQNTGETDDYLAISEGCRPCRDIASRVQGMFASGGYVKTDGWSIDRVIDRSGSTGGKVLDLRVTSAPTVLKESRTAKEQTLPGGEVVFRLRLNSKAPWQVTQLTQVAS